MPDDKRIRVEVGGFTESRDDRAWAEELQSETLDANEGPGLALMGCIVASAIGAVCVAAGGVILAGKSWGWW